MEDTVRESSVTLAGRYEVKALLGSGGMGTVYRVRDRELDEIVALKVLRRDLVGDPGALALFRSEVKLARRVTHRNVARTFDIGEHGEDRFLTMEHIDGASLAALLREEGPLAIADLIEVAAQLCAGLAAAHTVEVVHRDLKPANVMRTASGRVVITDFGIACARADPRAEHAIVGSPSYMAPEQFVGDAAADARVDVYSLGATLFELVTGRRPWPDEPLVSAARRRLEAAPPDPRLLREDVPAALADTLARCMAVDREARFRTAEAVAAAIAEMTAPAGAPAQARNVPAVDPGLERQPGLRTVAILPFRNTGADVDAYLAAGFTHDLMDALSLTAALRVRSAGAVAESSAAGLTATEIGRRLGVDAVVEGSIFRIADSVRVSARLVGVDGDLQLWASRATRPFSELLVVGDEMADAIAAALTVARDAPIRAAVDTGAVDFYLRARAAYHSDWSIHKEAPALFEQAVAHAPDDPMILAGYAMSLLRGVGPFSDADRGPVFARAREVAGRAAALGAHIAEAHLAVARVRFEEADVIGAAQGLRRALSLSQGSPDAHYFLGWMLTEIGDLRRGIDELRVAERLDPRMSVTWLDAMRAYALLGEWAIAEERPPRLDAKVEYPWLAQRIRLLMWRRDVARLRDLHGALRSRPDFAAMKGLPEVVASLLAGRMTRELAAIFVQAERAARDVPRRLIHVRQIACEHRAYGGEHDEALALVEAADAAKLFDITWLDRCPLLDALRDHPRFRAVRDRVAARADAGLAALEAQDPFAGATRKLAPPPR